MSTHSLLGSVGTKSWKTLRDERVVKQDLDYSCGAASLATLFNEHYGQSVTEEQVLTAMDTGGLMASFEDMRRAVAQFGFRAVGIPADYEQLNKLRMPVIVYLKYRQDDHFSVLRGVDENTVWLADPSQGNRTYSRWQFLDMWDTREDELNGKVLAVVPAQSEASTDTDFFTKQPKRQTVQAIAQLAIRPRR